MQAIAVFVLFAAVASWSFAQTPPPEKPKKKSMVKGRELVFDTDALPTDQSLNPYNVLASQNCWTKPALDHTGKPHHHGHLIQVIVDGGNGIQDVPNPDGSPGGDDSLALGNFNMMRLTGLEDPPIVDGSSGMFYSKKYLVPFIPPPRAYYLRLWEGDNIATAPYYQDTAEYTTDGGDRGGAMITLRNAAIPMDVDWTFGSSMPRPKTEPDPKK